MFLVKGSPARASREREEERPQPGHGACRPQPHQHTAGSPSISEVASALPHPRHHRPRPGRALPGAGRRAPDCQPGLKSTPRLVAARYGRSDGGCPQINISIAPAPSHPSACLGSYLMHQNNSSSLIYCGRLQILTWVLWPGLAPARASIKHNTAPHHPNLSSALLPRHSGARRQVILSAVRVRWFRAGRGRGRGRERCL